MKTDQSTHEIAGFLLIKKSLAVSSFGCVKAIRYALPKKTRIGHAGTLDPYATGLLIIAVGRAATRRLQELSHLPKEYVAKIKMGEQTNTLDIEGEITQTCAFEHVSQSELENALASFGSEYKQVPPVFSALNHEGSKLYNLVRKNIMSLDEVKEIAHQKAKMVQLHTLKLISYEPPFFTIKTRVSHGTYIRSLVRDIAQRADTCATMIELARTAIGPFNLDKAVSIDHIDTIEDVQKNLISIDDFFAQIS